MNTKSVLALALALVCRAAFAVEPIQPEANLAGLQVSLTTSGYKFFLTEPSPLPTAAKLPVKPARESFIASVLVANRSGNDITFTFPNAAAAQTHWTFRIFNSAGTELWKSDSEVFSAQVLTEDTLEKRGRWKRLIQVPLRIGGKLLPPGLYTLEASLDSDKTFGTTAIFEVAKPPIAELR